MRFRAHILRKRCRYGALARCLDSCIYTPYAQKLNMRANCTPYATWTQDNARFDILRYMKSGSNASVCSYNKIAGTCGPILMPRWSLNKALSAASCQGNWQQRTSSRASGRHVFATYVCLKSGLKLCPCWCTNQRPATPPAPDHMGSAQEPPSLPYHGPQRVHDAWGPKSSPMQLRVSLNLDTATRKDNKSTSMQVPAICS